MKLTETRSRELLRARGVFVKNACDRCGAAIHYENRFTRFSEKGVWCSRLCRDGVEHNVGTCRRCGVALKGKRKGALFCSAVCRMRQNGRHRPNNAKTHIQNTPLTDAISGFGYVGTLEQRTPQQTPPVQEI
jgi:hypothetical protein